MYAKTESEVSIQNKMGEVSEKQNLERLQKVTLSVLIILTILSNILQNRGCLSDRTRLEKLLCLSVSCLFLCILGLVIGMIFKVRKEKSYFKNQLNIFIRRVQDYSLLKKMQATIRDLIISPITQDGSIYLSEINQMYNKRFV